MLNKHVPVFPGISFDLTPLRKADGGYYNISNDKYDYFINVCGSVKAADCPEKSGACQVDKRQVHSSVKLIFLGIFLDCIYLFILFWGSLFSFYSTKSNSWNLGESNSSLSYYDGMIELDYVNGSRYNNEEHTQRSTHISFLCDLEAGPGKPEFQVRNYR